MTLIPTLETDRLIMRAPEMQDFDAYAEFLTTERSHMVGGPLDRTDAWLRFAAIAGHWSLYGYGRWVLDVKDGDANIGFVGLLNPEGWPEPEIGWTVFANGEGKGYAFEAAKAARDYVYNTLGWDRVVSLIDPKNTRSLALGERMGLTHDYDHDHPKFGTLSVYVHPAPEAMQ